MASTASSYSATDMNQAHSPTTYFRLHWVGSGADYARQVSYLRKPFTLAVVENLMDRNDFRSSIYQGPQYASHLKSSAEESRLRTSRLVASCSSWQHFINDRLTEGSTKSFAVGDNPGAIDAKKRRKGSDISMRRSKILCADSRCMSIEQTSFPWGQKLYEEMLEEKMFYVKKLVATEIFIEEQMARQDALNKLFAKICSPHDSEERLRLEEYLPNAETEVSNLQQHCETNSTDEDRAESPRLKDKLFEQKRLERRARLHSIFTQDWLNFRDRHRRQDKEELSRRIYKNETKLIIGHLKKCAKIEVGRDRKGWEMWNTGSY